MVIVVTSPRRLTLAGQVLALQLAVVFVVLAIIALLSLHQSTDSFVDEQGSRMRGVAEYLANDSVVREFTDDPHAAQRLAPPIERAVSLSGATDVTVTDAEGVVVSSSDVTRVGRPARLGESDALGGRGWSGTVSRPDGRVISAHAPVLDDDGQLLGLVLAEQRYPSTWQLLTDSGTDLAVFLGLGAGLGVSGTWLVARALKRRTRGLDAAQIATLADHREALLHSIREGVVGVDTRGRISILNDGARELLDLPATAVGRRVDDLGLDPAVVSLLAGRGDVQDALAVVGSRVLVVNRRTARSRGRGVGSVTTMRDRTELVEIQHQLSSNLSITDTLRAQTHEFTNQLHTISGLLQLGAYGEVTQVVGTVARRRADLDATITERIGDRALAALLVAKSSVALERGVRLTLTPDSRLEPLPDDLSADLITVLGNLVDNAVDACSAVTDPRVDVAVQERNGGIHLRVRDNGPGIAPELLDTVFVRGFSTKEQTFGGRGIGLPLVRVICRQRGGEVRVTNDDGAVFDVELPKGGRR
ncbi:sensor histidine kinase [Aeromicrobium camelliae]|uniref:sensor histidine kinase n=1 Tax=Aeromicrobium camelliae TaxID=1538144 RepID=UPI001AA020C0|nr:sensor histidine kinase [Aeromicrobium camelliae]